MQPITVAPEYYTPDDFFDPERSAQLAQTFGTVSEPRETPYEAPADEDTLWEAEQAYDWRRDVNPAALEAEAAYYDQLQQERNAAPTLDLTPRALADALDALVAATMATDCETAAVLQHCREGLRAISWNRYAATQSRRSRARVLRRRHQTRRGGHHHA